MNCHENNNENHNGNERGHKHSPMKHMLHMLLCCGIPIIIVGFLPLISRVSPGAAGFVSRIVPFLCPIMMITMMFSMFGGKGGSKKKSCCEDKPEKGTTKEIV